MEPTEETSLIEMLKLGLEKLLYKLQEISSQASNFAILGKAPIQLKCNIHVIFSGWFQHGTHRRDSLDRGVETWPGEIS